MILAKFVLIVVFYKGGTLTAPFHTAEACEAARKSIIADVRNPMASGTWVEHAQCHWTGL